MPAGNRESLSPLMLRIDAKSIGDQSVSQNADTMRIFVYYDY